MYIHGIIDKSRNLSFKLVSQSEEVKCMCETQGAAPTSAELDKAIPEESTLALEAYLTASPERLRTLLHTLPGGVVVLEAQSEPTILVCNTALSETLGYTTDEMMRRFGENFTRLIHPLDADAFHQAWHEACRHNGEFTFRLRKRDGGTTWMRMYTSLFSEDGKERVYCVFADINQEKEQEIRSTRANERLKFRAEHDPMTGICNREAFFEQTTALLRDNPQNDYIIACIRIQRFSEINLLFGDRAADRILKALADYLNATWTQVGTFGRLGGNLFGVCIPSGLMSVEQLLRRLKRAINLPTIRFEVNVSMGMYETTSGLRPISEMCHCAALAMGEADDPFHSSTQVFSEEMEKRLERQLRLINDAEAALNAGQFVMFLQPVFSLRTHGVISAEALVRWQHPQLGLLMPGAFLSLFESNGFIRKLDRFVWESACRFQQERRKQQRADIPISVNLSSLTVMNELFVREFSELAQRYDVSPQQLSIEIEEGSYAQHYEDLRKAAANLRKAGFHVLLDDFGRGSSSLNMLRDTEADSLKINIHLMQTLQTHDVQGRLICPVLELAKALNLSVIAEGVETREQIDFLNAVGHENIQGYYFSTPLPVQDFHY